MQTIPKAAARYVVRAAVDGLARARGHHDPLVPPTRLMYDGPQDRDEFIRNGEAYFEHFKELLHLAPDEAVLDVGSGMGRKTRLLTQYLVPPGRYVGLDIVQKGVDWCTHHITSRYPNFTFEHIDVANSMYNPKGTFTATTYKFPFANEMFDVAILGSVFTHMLPEEADNYLGELTRVLRPGARTLITYFLLNDTSRQLIAEGRAKYSFGNTFDRYSVDAPDVPMAAVAFKEEEVRELYRRHHLVIDEPIRYGSWAGRAEFLDFQDIVIAGKPR